MRSEEFQGRVDLWALDDGATVCIKRTQDGVLVLQWSDAGKIDTAALDPSLVQMISGHSARLLSTPARRPGWLSTVFARSPTRTRRPQRS
ncbi:hypothetical protein DW2_00235 [Thioclava atlantica]|uniref:Uncharacterized protein n=1 Tax=Thioclava atlantica TaxID=1317124 RepID=A0A085U0P2_9RHOB|nr:hypothetical protein DW2_00235 [Thioclava atlantica]